MVLEHFTGYSTKNWPREEVRLAQAAAFTGSRDLWVLTAPIDHRRCLWEHREEGPLGRQLCKYMCSLLSHCLRGVGRKLEMAGGQEQTI